MSEFDNEDNAAPMTIENSRGIIYEAESYKAVLEPYLDDLMDGQCVMEFGCGSGYYAEFIANTTGADVYCVDIEDRNLDLIRQVNNPNLIDVTTTDTIPPGSLELINIKDTLVHIESERREELYSDMYKLLKPGGKLIIATSLEKYIYFLRVVGYNSKMFKFDDERQCIQVRSEMMEELNNCPDCDLEVFWPSPVYQVDKESVLSELKNVGFKVKYSYWMPPEDDVDYFLPGDSERIRAVFVAEKPAI